MDLRKYLGQAAAFNCRARAEEDSLCSQVGNNEAEDGTVCRVRYDGADTLAAVLEKVGGAKKNPLAVEGMRLCDEEGTPVRRTYPAPRTHEPWPPTVSAAHIKSAG